MPKVPKPEPQPKKANKAKSKTNQPPSKKPKTLLEHVLALLSEQAESLGLLQIKKGLLDMFEMNCSDGAAKTRLLTALKQGVQQGLLGKVGPKYFLVGSKAEANIEKAAENAALTAASFELLEAVRAGNLVKCQEAIAAGANVNFKDTRNGWYKHSPLITAAFHENLVPNMEPIVKLLLKEKANPNAYDSLGNTALDHCTSSASLVQLLLEHNAEVNVATQNVTT